VELVVGLARIVLWITAAFCLTLSLLFLVDAIRAIVAQLRLTRGDYAGALAIYERLLHHAWQPYARRRAIAYNAAVALHRSGNLEAAALLLERLVTEERDPLLDALCHALLGQTLVLMGRDLDRAEASLARAGARLDFSHFGLTRAVLNLLVGDRESARRDLETVLERGEPEPVLGFRTLALVEREFEETMRSYLLALYHLLNEDPESAHPLLATAAAARVPSTYRDRARALLGGQFDAAAA
jgi:tetratricopeptide (TPR) repeat protein